MKESHAVSNISVVLKRVLLLFAVLAVCFLIGTFGYYLIEGWTFADAFYMTAITISAVGFREIGSLSLTGRLFTIFLIFMGVTLLAGWVAIVTSFLVGADLRNYFRRKKMFDKIKNMKHHTILCGGGTTGRVIVEEFKKGNQDLIIVEQDQSATKKIEDKFPNIPIIHANATSEESLWIANIKAAGCLISALSSDIDNLYVVITARDLNPNLFIVARCFDDSIAHRIHKAGANEVISPNRIGGQRIAEICFSKQSS
ncbi:potassium channel family protein [Candidatus Omnitrophota bacterium]